MAHGRTPDASFGALAYEGDRWTLHADGRALDFSQTPSVFTLGNGFIGVRGPGDPAGAPKVYLNGVFERTPIEYHEAAYGYARESDTRVAVAEATRVEITVEGETVPVVALELNFANGTLRETRRTPSIVATVQTLVSMRHTGVIAVRVTIRAETPATVHVAHPVKPPPCEPRAAEPVYDPRVGPTPAQSPWTGQRLVVGPEHRGRVDRLARSGYVVAALARTLDVTVALAAGETRTIDAFAAYAAECGGDPLLAAEQALAQATAAGFDTLAAEQAAWFADYWRGADVAVSNESAEQALRHGLFQLAQAVGRDGRTSLAAKGQSGEGYEGHVFWDAEIYALPMFVHTAPAIARGMLVWRIGLLEKARANARLMGPAAGALYPWRTVAGAECSSFFPAGQAQYHLNADIAYALRMYISATADRTILAEGGAEMLAETARIWLQIGFHDAARGAAFVINRVTGPDEYSALVDNNLYTNLMAAEHLRFAAEAGDVEPEEAAAMRRAADAMFVAYEEAHGVPAQDDSFLRLRLGLSTPPAPTNIRCCCTITRCRSTGIRSPSRPMRFSLRRCCRQPSTRRRKGGCSMSTKP